MISKLLYAFEQGLAYVKNHPQVLFVLFLVFLLPLAFLYSSNQFLKTGQSNTNTLVYQRIGLLNDVFAELALTTEFNNSILQRSIEDIASLNQDVTKFRVVIDTEQGLTVTAALDQTKIGSVEDNRNLYEKSFGEPTGITFPFSIGEKQYIQSFRAVKRNEELLGYIFIESDQTALNSVLDERKNSAYLSLFVLYLVLLALAYWHIRITDYRYMYKKAKKAIETKDLFTNMIAHELRAPLTAIRGYASMIDESEKAHEEDRKYAVRIKDSSERLLEIVNDLLDVARIQSGKLSIDKEMSDITRVVVTVIEELQPSAMEKNIKLSSSGTDVAHSATIDPKRFHQALTNLVSNAIKYTKHGVIDLTVDESVQNIEIRVKDTGMGISADDQKKLFAPFFRVENEDVSQITGTGLGMWITHQLIELMGSTINVESIKGVGTHVVIKIPKEVGKKA